jgi:hypothetical protein
MTPKTNNTKFNRLSKSQRTHERRMKQAARLTGETYRSLTVYRAPAKKTGG